MGTYKNLRVQIIHLLLVLLLERLVNFFRYIIDASAVLNHHIIESPHVAFAVTFRLCGLCDRLSHLLAVTETWLCRVYFQLVALCFSNWVHLPDKFSDLLVWLEQAVDDCFGDSVLVCGDSLRF